MIQTSSISVGSGTRVAMTAGRAEDAAADGDADDDADRAPEPETADECGHAARTIIEWSVPTTAQACVGTHHPPLPRDRAPRRRRHGRGVPGRGHAPRPPVALKFLAAARRQRRRGADAAGARGAGGGAAALAAHRRHLRPGRARRRALHRDGVRRGRAALDADRPAARCRCAEALDIAHADRRRPRRGARAAASSTATSRAPT